MSSVTYFHSDSKHNLEYTKEQSLSTISETKCCANFNWKKAFKISLAELIGSFFLMAVGCMGVATAGPFAGLSFGFTIVFVILMFGHISGSHVNPSVTLGCLIMGYISPKLSMFYFIPQFMGCFLGYLLPYYFVIKNNEEYPNCVTDINKNLKAYEGLIIEMFSSAILMMLVCSANDPRNDGKTGSVGLKTGFGLASIYMAFGPLTGASINTARSLPPAVMNNKWNEHWVYWIGPNVGAASAALLYKYVFEV